MKRKPIFTTVLNSEGDILKARKIDSTDGDVFLLKHYLGFSYGSKELVLSREEFTDFLEGKMVLIDIEGKMMNYPEYPSGMKNNEVLKILE
jgi:hypothetical protein